MSRSRSHWASEADALLHGVSGGLIFGMPLLYTQESWSIGSSTSPTRMLAMLGFTFASLVVVNRTAGFRSEQQTPFLRSLSDSVEAFALGVLLSGVCLAVLGRFDSDMAAREIVGRTCVVGIPFALGVGVANGILHRFEDSTGLSATSASVWRQTLADMGATALGATVLLYAIAPTEEVYLLASELGASNLVALVFLSILSTYLIVFQAQFNGRHIRRHRKGIFRHPFSETCASYIVAVTFGGLSLTLFSQFSSDDSFTQNLAQLVVLGFPASLGGAAGRLVL